MTGQHKNRLFAGGPGCRPQSADASQAETRSAVETLLRGWFHPGIIVRMRPVVERLADRLDDLDPGGVLGFYVFGSSVAGGLRPESDVDLLLVTERSLNADDREELVRFLLQFSGRRATAVPGRPLELTSVVGSEVAPWTYPPMCDFLYGEWLRTEIDDGQLPQRHVNPDLAVLLTMVQQQAQIVRGPKPIEVLDPVPEADLRSSLRDGLEPLLDDLIGDERNVLLTLARMIATLRTGEILSKDAAARQIATDLCEPFRSVLNLAAAGYLGKAEDDWSQCHEQATETATHLAAQIRAAFTD